MAEFSESFIRKADNKREFPRAALKIDGEYIFRGSRYKWKIEDISQEGIGGKINQVLYENDELKLIFSLPEISDTFVVEAKVVYAKLPRVGLKFTNISPKQRAKINEFIKRNAQFIMKKFSSFNNSGTNLPKNDK